MTGWTGNVFIIIGILLLAYRKKSGFLCGIIGSAMWCYRGVATNQPDLASIEGVIAVLQCFSYYQWSKFDKKGVDTYV
jgi:hypothetical protein